MTSIGSSVRPFEFFSQPGCKEDVAKLGISVLYEFIDFILLRFHVFDLISQVSGTMSVTRKVHNSSILSDMIIQKLCEQVWSEVVDPKAHLKSLSR